MLMAHYLFLFELFVKLVLGRVTLRLIIFIQLEVVGGQVLVDHEVQIL